MDNIVVEGTTIVNAAHGGLVINMKRGDSLGNLRAVLRHYGAYFNPERDFDRLYVSFDTADKAPVFFTTPGHNADALKLETLFHSNKPDGKVFVLALLFALPHPVHDFQCQQQTNIAVEVTTIVNAAHGEFKINMKSGESLGDLRAVLGQYYNNTRRNFDRLFVSFDTAAKAPVLFTTRAHNADDMRLGTLLHSDKPDGKVFVLALKYSTPHPVHDAQGC